jgi:hypothetical protein
MYEQLRKLRPFRHSPGRVCSGFEKISSTPVTAVMMDGMRATVERIIFRLTRGLQVAVEHDDENADNDIGDNLPNLY